ncbi:transglycosylase family protein [Streptomyces cinnamoneus]|uniref:transglycosylase family protein n=1 Tax=Streptomyces cinnamoneus TaxID=53446 RepID=UPI003792B5D7
MVAAGVTGASIAMPLLAATGANAADADTWDHVAQCESGGVWSANSESGYYGGLMLTQEMWDQNGGTAYAPRPDMASRAQQITVADRILRARGADSWKGCGAGLTKEEQTRTPEVNPGTAIPSTPEPSHKPAPERPTPSSTPERTSPAPSSSPSSAPSGTPSAPTPGTETPTPGTSQTPGASTSPSAPVIPSPSAPVSGTPETGEGKHRKDPSGEPSGSATTAPGTPSADPASPAAPSADDTSEPGTGKHRAEPPRSDDAQRPSRGTEAGRTDLPAAGDYTVRPGDNLSVIAEEHSVAGGWQTIYQKNEKAVGSDPNLIHPGQRLDIHKE